MEYLQTLLKRGSWRFCHRVHQQMIELHNILRRDNTPGSHEFGTLEFWGLDGLTREELEDSMSNNVIVANGEGGTTNFTALITMEYPTTQAFVVTDSDEEIKGSKVGEKDNSISKVENKESEKKVVHVENEHEIIDISSSDSDKQMDKYDDKRETFNDESDVDFDNKENRDSGVKIVYESELESNVDGDEDRYCNTSVSDETLPPPPPLKRCKRMCIDSDDDDDDCRELKKLRQTECQALSDAIIAPIGASVATPLASDGVSAEAGEDENQEESSQASTKGTMSKISSSASDDSFRYGGYTHPISCRKCMYYINDKGLCACDLAFFDTPEEWYAYWS